MTYTDHPQLRELLPAFPSAETTATRSSKSYSPKPSNSRQLTRIACEPCRQKKSKCDGTRPKCNRCANEQSVCFFDCEPDMSRATSLKRKNQALQQRVSQFEELTDLLASRPRNESLAILDLLRMKREPDSLGSLLSFIRNGDLFAQCEVNASKMLLPRDSSGNIDLGALSDLLRSAINDGDDPNKRAEYSTLISELERISGFETAASRAAKRGRIYPLGTASLVRPRISVKAKPWTTITDDDDLVTHLVSLFVDWEAHCVGIVDCDSFLEGMEKGDLNSPYCSPFVVNSMCAYACKMHYTPYPQNPGMSAADFEELGNQFFQEAKSMWEAECGRPCLTNMYGLHIMHIWYGVSGRDRMSFLYMNQLFAMAEDVGLNNSELDSTFDPQMLRARRIAIWGLYISTMTSHVVCLRVPPATFIAKSPRPFGKDELTTPEKWSPYPLHNREMDGYLRLRFEESATLACIAHEVLKLLYGGELKDPPLDAWNEAQHLHERLLQWHAALPDCIAARNTAPAHILTLHLLYNCVQMALFGPFRGIEHDAFLIHAQKARELYLKFATQLGQIVSYYYHLYSAQGSCGVAVFPAWSVSGLIDVVRCQPKLAHLLHDNLELAVKVSFTMKLCRGILRVNLDRIKNLPAHSLQKRTVRLIEDFESNVWQTDEAVHYSSFFPECSSATENLVRDRGVKKFQLSEMLQRLSLGDVK